MQMLSESTDLKRAIPHNIITRLLTLESLRLLMNTGEKKFLAKFLFHLRTNNLYETEGN